MDDAIILQVATTPDIRKIFKVLRKRIVRRKMPQGTRLREGDLAEEFDVSRAKIREVIILLEHRGLIERQANKGAVVRSYSLNELISIFEVFGALIGLATYQATKRAKPGTWQPFLTFFKKNKNSEMSESVVRECLAEVNKMLLTIVITSKNDPLAAIIYEYFDIVGPYMQKLFLVSQHLPDAMGIHAVMLKAMIKGDAVEAEHIRHGQSSDTQAALVKYYDLIV